MPPSLREYGIWTERRDYMATPVGNRVLNKTNPAARVKMASANWIDPPGVLASSLTVYLSPGITPLAQR
jgi:hypothetical protein